jgi:hypothetical protein
MSHASNQESDYEEESNEEDQQQDHTERLLEIVKTHHLPKAAARAIADLCLAMCKEAHEIPSSDFVEAMAMEMDQAVAQVNESG